jgi:DNA-binding CsgD family transcriptional regulator
MDERLTLLSGREREVLRLLLVGHDAKSMANALELSVHTVNEHLRDARRKLGVSSSREAARLMAAMEREAPKLFGDKEFDQLVPAPEYFGDRKLGVAHPDPRLQLLQLDRYENRPRAMGLPIAWLVGGVLLMSLTVAALALLLALGTDGPAQSVPAAPAAPGQTAFDLMPFADADQDGKVTAQEYAAFTEQGWQFVARDQEQVDFAALGQSEQVAFVGIMPNERGIITRQAYIDAIPSRFKMLDTNGDNVLSSDELNGRTYQR